MLFHPFFCSSVLTDFSIMQYIKQKKPKKQKHDNNTQILLLCSCIAMLNCVKHTVSMLSVHFILRMAMHGTGITLAMSFPPCSPLFPNNWDAVT